jgi:formylglycine-generating enzyme required for sulfatase activity
VQAAAACAQAGKRLCTLTEWLAACQGPNGWTYPYGNSYMAGACNEGRATNPVNDCFGSGSNVFTYSNMNSPCCDDQPNTVAPGGSFPRCRSYFDIYDLHGNLHEWVDATTATGNGIFKGGFFVDATINGPGCRYATTAHAKTYHDYSTGFRCCANPR